MNYRVPIGVCSIAFSALACQPVIAIGWREVACTFVLVVFLLGPPVYRFFRRLEKK